MCELKTCKECGAAKPLDDFYHHPQTKDGLTSKCKECTRAAVRQRRDANLDHYREYDRQRARSEARKEYAKKYQRSPAGRAAAQRYRDKKRGA